MICKPIAASFMLAATALLPAITVAAEQTPVTVPPSASAPVQTVVITGKRLPPPDPIVDAVCYAALGGMIGLCMLSIKLMTSPPVRNAAPKRGL